MTAHRCNIYAEIDAERRRQNAFVEQGKFPFNCSGQAPLTSKLAILGEEFGEVSECVVEIELIGKGKKSMADLRKEVLHIAAVAVAWLESLEPASKPLREQILDAVFTPLQ